MLCSGLPKHLSSSFFPVGRSQGGLGYDVESISSIGVEELPLDELDKSKLMPEIVSLAERLPRRPGTVGGMIVFPLAI